MRLADALAFKAAPIYRLEIEEARSVARLALCEAAERYEPSSGAFRSFAWTRMLGALKDEGRRRPGGRYVLPLEKRYRDAERRLAQLEQRTPTFAEIVAAAGLSSKDLERLVRGRELADLASLDEPVGEDLSLLGELLEDEGPAAVEGLLEEEQALELWSAIDRLGERERMVIELLYLEDWTLERIGEALGLTASRICQIHAAALKRLEARLEAMA